MVDSEIPADIKRAARDWLVRIQLGDASGPGETADGRVAALAAFEAWRRADPRHGEAYDALQRLVQHSDWLAKGQLARDSRLSRASLWERRPLLSTAVAAALVAATGLTLCWSAGIVPSRMGVFQGAEAHLALADTRETTAVGQTRQIMLPDGSGVLLDTDSELRVHFTAGERRLRLDRGRARFSVAHEAARPFVVDAGEGSIIAHGTVFDVSVSAKGTHVLLLRGMIEVRRARVASGANTAGAATVAGDVRHLQAGEAISLDPAIPLPQASPMAKGEADWISGRLSFSDTRLGDAIEAVNRYNTGKIALAPAVDANLTVSGGFDARAPRAFAAAVAMALGLTVKPGPDGRLWLVPVQEGA